MRDSDGHVAIGRWWNGASAMLDLTNREANDWFIGQLRSLQDKFGIDGFKLDGGNASMMSDDFVYAQPCDGNEYSRLFAEIGLHFPLNELRACWKAAGRPLVQRLKDKRHDWDDLRTLVPCTLTQGLLGYAFTCPDMIGGGEYQTFQPGCSIDEELVVRSAQCSALLPMMQFSVAPWRVLSEANAALCLKAAKLHVALADDIHVLATHAAATGEPMVRPLEYVFPSQGFEDCTDQFMLGDDILVAPVTAPGARSRPVRFPPGRWQSDGYEDVTGPAEQTIETPLDRLPWWRREAPRS